MSDADYERRAANRRANIKVRGAFHREYRNQIIQELIEKAEAEIKCDVLGHRMVPLHAADWLKSQMEGGE